MTYNQNKKTSTHFTCITMLICLLLISLTVISQNKNSDIVFKLNKEQLLETGHSFAEKAEYGNAIIYYKAGLKQATKENEYYWAAQFHKNIAIAKDELSDFSNAKNHIHKAINLAIKLNDNELINEALNILGSIYLGGGEYDKALEVFYRILWIEQSTGNLKAYSNILNNIGIIFYSIGDYENALNNYLESFEIKSNIGDSVELTGVSLNLGSVYLSLQEYDKAANYYNIAADLALKLNNKNRYISAINNKAFLKMQTGEYSKAKELLYSIIDIAKTENHLLNSLYINRNLGECYMSENNFSKALNYINKAIIIAESLMITEPLIDLYNLKSECLKETGYYQAALESYRISSQISDSLNAMELQKQLYNYQTNYEVKLKEEQIKIRDLEIESQKSKIRNQWILFGSFSTGIMIFILLIIINQRNKNKLRTESFRKQIVKFQQMALSAQLNPHFISNSLNSIQRFYLTNDIETASEYLSDFGSLVRTTLEHSSKAKISVQEEIKFIQYYLSLEKLRMENKFNFRIYTDDVIDLSKYYLPPLIIQPFVENAVWHGISGLQEKELGEIVINFYPEKGFLCIEIDDNGIGLERSIELKKQFNNKRKSYSLNINTQRLDLIQKLINQEIIFEIFDKKRINKKGTKVIIKIPEIFAKLAEL